jgi:hypothetical protein
MGIGLLLADQDKRALLGTLDPPQAFATPWN